jgi:GNAT superfamily N-acetyltransferase
LLGEILTKNPAMYEIRAAKAGDAQLLPPIERSAGELFRSDSELAWIADDDVQDVDTHLNFIANGTAWVAVGPDDAPIAFLNGEAIGGCFHIWEMSVHMDHQRQGLGSKLIETARRYAVDQGYQAMTLTTFRRVAWNEAFYARQGFELVQGHQLSDALSRILADEVAHGLPAERRCAMAMPLEEHGL